MPKSLDPKIVTAHLIDLADRYKTNDPITLIDFSNLVTKNLNEHWVNDILSGATLYAEAMEEVPGGRQVWLAAIAENSSVKGCSKRELVAATVRNWESAPGGTEEAVKNWQSKRKNRHGARIKSQVASNQRRRALRKASSRPDHDGGMVPQAPWPGPTNMVPQPPASQGAGLGAAGVPGVDPPPGPGPGTSAGAYFHPDNHIPETQTPHHSQAYTQQQQQQQQQQYEYQQQLQQQYQQRHPTYTDPRVVWNLGQGEARANWLEAQRLAREREDFNFVAGRYNTEQAVRGQVNLNNAAGLHGAERLAAQRQGLAQGQQLWAQQQALWAHAPSTQASQAEGWAAGHYPTQGPVPGAAPDQWNGEPDPRWGQSPQGGTHSTHPNVFKR